MAKTPHILLNKARNIEDLCQSASGIPDLVPVLITVYVPDYRNDTDFLCLFHPLMQKLNKKFSQRICVLQKNIRF